MIIYNEKQTIANVSALRTVQIMREVKGKGCSPEILTFWGTEILFCGLGLKFVSQFWNNTLTDTDFVGLNILKGTVKGSGVDHSSLTALTGTKNSLFRSLFAEIKEPYQSGDWRYVFPTNEKKDVWALADHLFDHVTKCLCAWNDIIQKQFIYRAASGWKCKYNQISVRRNSNIEAVRFVGDHQPFEYTDKQKAYENENNNNTKTKTIATRTAVLMIYQLKK